MNISSNLTGDTLVLSVNETRIDAAVAIQFKDKIRAEIAPDSDRVVLDLSQVEFLDSSGLGAVVAALKMLDPGRKLELAGLTPAVAKVFRLTRMDSVFRIHADVAAAHAAGSQAA